MKTGDYVRHKLTNDRYVLVGKFLNLAKVVYLHTPDGSLKQSKRYAWLPLAELEPLQSPQARVVGMLGEKAPLGIGEKWWR